MEKTKAITIKKLPDGRVWVTMKYSHASHEFGASNIFRAIQRIEAFELEDHGGYVPDHDADIEAALQDLLEWVKGNRGNRVGNPYCFEEVRRALKALAAKQGITDWLDAITDRKERT